MPLTSWKWPLSSPFRHSLLRLRLKYTARPVRTVSSNASRFIQASISTCPVSASWATAGTSPPALSKFTMSVVPRRGRPPKLLPHVRAVQDDQPPDAEREEEDGIGTGERQASHH